MALAIPLRDLVILIVLVIVIEKPAAEDDYD